jgi:hypothetical protein
MAATTCRQHDDVSRDDPLAGIRDENLTGMAVSPIAGG